MAGILPRDKLSLSQWEVVSAPGNQPDKQITPRWRSGQSRDDTTRTSVVANHGGEGRFRNRARLEHTQRRIKKLLPFTVHFASD